jgi:hypothetical protein
VRGTHDSWQTETQAIGKAALDSKVLYLLQRQYHFTCDCGSLRVLLPTPACLVAVQLSLLLVDDANRLPP